MTKLIDIYQETELTLTTAIATTESTESTDNEYDFSDIDNVIERLSLKERKFALHYAVTLNKTQSAIFAGYQLKNVRSVACNLSKNVNVAKYVLFLLHQERMLGKATKQDLIRRCNMILETNKGAGAKLSAINLIMKLTGLDSSTRPIFGDNNLITITIAKKETE